MSAPAAPWARDTVCLAPAKLNLSLSVLGRRPDGYHELDTELVALSLCDLVRVRVVPERVLELVVDGPAASEDVLRAPANLALAAAEGALELVRHLADGPLGLRVRLTKRVPSRSGLGGASSDAAAAQLAARDALAAHLGPAVLEVLDEAGCLRDLAALGSDTVFFHAARFSGSARARGRGERVEALPPRPRAWFALVVPDVACATPVVYGAVAAAGTGSRSGSNDLEAAALRAYPELGEWFDALGPGFALSGSGSALYASAPDEAGARALVERARAAAARLGRTPRLVTVARAVRHGVRLVAAEPRAQGAVS